MNKIKHLPVHVVTNEIHAESVEPRYKHYIASSTLFLLSIAIPWTTTAGYYSALYQDFCEHFFSSEQPPKRHIVAWDMLLDSNQSLKPHAGLPKDFVHACAQNQGQDPISLEPLSSNPAKLLVLPYYKGRQGAIQNDYNAYVYHLFNMQTFLKLIETARQQQKDAQEPLARDIIPQEVQESLYRYCKRTAPFNYNTNVWQLCMLVDYAFRS